MSTEAKSVLAVIGNGFDLELGLKTRYEDFFEWLKESSNTASFLVQYKDTEFSGINFEKNEEAAKSTLDDWWSWHFIRKNSDFSTWSSVEDEIKKVVSNLQVENLQPPTKIGEVDWVNAYDVLRFTKGLYPPQGADNYEWLLSELKKFEELFKSYVVKQVSNDYQESANMLLEKLVRFVIDNEFQSRDFETQIETSCEAEQFAQGQILNFDVSEFLSLKHYRYLLNFNYTLVVWMQPSYPSEEVYEEDRALSQINLHGDIESEIIFGIDETADVPEGAEIFKKTHRKLFQKHSRFKLPNKLDYLLVYGQSLDPADYSYFQSLFDLYDIYGGKTKLFFFIKDKKGNVSEKTNSIYKLFHTYGEDVLGKAKGKNLLHKLLLENRIQIVLTSSIKDFDGNPNG